MERQENGAFSDNPFMIGYDNSIFEHDEELGFKFPEGRLVGESEFISLDSQISNIQRNTGYPVILSLGDSSTSGWNGNRVFKGNTNPHIPFFTYPTYSDILRQDQNYPNVINAGVHGYSSLQGRKYIEILLRQLSREKVQVDYVTVFFGNNDGTYNNHEDKVRLDAKKESINATGERVSVKDFQRNLESMAETIREYGARPVLIVPPVNYDWEAGIRSQMHKDESIEVLRKLDKTFLADELNKARELYFEGHYREAVEIDRVLPRLKQDYRKAILKASKKTKTPVIDVQRAIPLRSRKLFADYCHPLEKINRMIADELISIRDKEAFRESVRKIVKNLWNGFRKDIKRGNAPSPDIYTIH